MREKLKRARQFLFTHGRLLERRQFEVRFAGGDPDIVGRVVKAYQNADGGLGHALEPDIRTPLSQPGFIGFGLAALTDAGCRDAAFALSLCDYLAKVADDRGLVPFLFEQALDTPVAPHWANPSVTFGTAPDVNPTAEICAFLHFQGIEHDWLSLATETCYRLLIDKPPAEAHALACAARLTEHVPDRTMAGNLLDMLAETLPKAMFYQPDAPVSGYGLTPLAFAPRPDSVCRSLFAQSQLDGHLDELAARQQEDGGWPISWEAPHGAAALEWRGKVTLDAVSVLHAYRQ